MAHLPPSRRAAAAALFVTLLLCPAALAGDEPSKPARKPKLVELTIKAEVSEDPVPHDPLGLSSRRNFRGELERIREMAADPQVAAVQLVIEGTPSWAHLIDLRDELSALKGAGKKVVCYAETMGRNDALLATMADLLAVPPSGLIALEPLVAELLYMRDLLAKADARVEVLHIGEYKTAYENLARDAMSDGQREVIEALLDEFYEQAIATLAANRGLSRGAIEALFDSVFVEPRVAAEAGLVDAVLSEEAFEQRVQELLGGEYEVVESYGGLSKDELKKKFESPFAMMSLFLQMLEPPKREAPREPYVAIVYASGAITSGESKADFQGRVSSMGSDTIVEALREVGKDENCKAVVLRVNSPGGSALASDMIWQAIEDVQRKGKPVVSSMGSVAGSGGYWISMGCDAIVAQPSTLTGSIGVVSMLPDLSRTLGNLGVNVEVVSRGPHGDEMALLANGPTPFLRELLQRFMNQVYDEFLTKVSEGRKLPREVVESLAHGRVWTGRQAVENGLADELGGLRDGIALARALGGLKADSPLHELPPAPNPLEALEEMFGASVGAALLSPVEALLTGLGFGDLVATTRALLSDAARPLSSERVLAVMPGQILVR